MCYFRGHRRQQWESGFRLSKVDKFHPFPRLVAPNRTQTTMVSLARRPLPVASESLAKVDSIRIGVDIPPIGHHFLRVRDGTLQRNLLSGCDEIGRASCRARAWIS